MGQSLSQIYVHLIFSTKGREPLLLGALRGQAQASLAEVLNNHGSPALKVGGTSDHVHALFGLAKKRALAEVVEEIKASSSKRIKKRRLGLGGFHWQSGCGGFSVSPGEVEEYIEQQEEHHQTISIQEEYRGFLGHYHAKHDEHDVWDRAGLSWFALSGLRVGRGLADHPGRCPGLGSRPFGPKM
jgi:REP element-mobilizing transposase RayT